MTAQNTLPATIWTLINRKTEGSYWDFKRKHHEHNANLVHDVLCLANTTKHLGPRFLIFGVDDKDYPLHPIDTDPDRRTQADITSLFRDNANKFFQDRFPEFYLEEINLDGKLLDVLVIEDAPHKPYYLVENYKNLRAHHIYTRVGDTNTSVDGAAQPHEIERMWRERFGLDMPPIERFKRYLNEPDAWSSLIRDDGCNGDFYYDTFPEFTVRVTDAEDYIDRRQEWTRGEVRKDNNHAGYYELYYHQARLNQVHYVSFDDGRKSMVAPDWEPCGVGCLGSGRFYFYKVDSIKYAVQKFYSIVFSGDDSLTLGIKGDGKTSSEARSRWGHYLKIPVLHPRELEGFLASRSHSKGELVDPSTDESDQYEVFLRNLLDFEDWRSTGISPLRDGTILP